jgi:hypothetical protein
MANKHSRQGLALGVSLALGVTTLGVLPAQAVDFENLELTIAADDTNGVLATTMENDFELELEWDISNASDLAYLKYELTFNSSDESAIDAMASVNGISWDAAADDVVEIDEIDLLDSLLSYSEGEAPSEILSAPAYVIADDEYATYRVTRTNYYDDPENDVCSVQSSGPTAGAALGLDPVLNINEVPETVTIAGGGCDGSDIDTDKGIAVVSYAYQSGQVGEINAAAPASMQFESILWLESVISADDYVDVVVQAWLDKDGDNVKDSTESYAAPVTVRFWNPTALTPALELGNEGVVWGEDVTIDYTVYLTQELNETYTEVHELVEEDFFVFSDLNYDNIRDGYVYQNGGDRPFDWVDLETFVFNDDKFSGKHLFQTGSIEVSNEDVTRVGVADYLSMEDDTYFPGGGDNVYEIVAGPTKVEFQDRTVNHFEGLLVEQTLAWSEGGAEDFGEDATDSNYYRYGDSFIHESVESVDFVITAYADADQEDVVAGVDVVVSGTYFDGNNDDEIGTEISVNGASIIDEDSTDADDGSFTVEGTTNAAGQLVLSIAVSDPNSDFYINLETIDAQGEDNWRVDYRGTGETAELVWEASDWDLIPELNLEAANDVDYRHVTVGESVQVILDVRDQWLQSPANGTAKVEFDFDTAAYGNTRDYEGYLGDGASVVNGRVSVSIPDVDPEAGEGRIEIDADLFVKQSNGLYRDIVTDEHFMELDYLDDAAVANLVMDEDMLDADVSYTDFLTANFNLLRMDEAYYVATQAAWVGDMAPNEDEDEFSEYGDGNWDKHIGGYLESADGVDLAGQKVTLSGSGLMFAEWYSSTYDDMSGIYATDSLTVFSDSDGYFDVHVWGHEVGVHTITITAGGKSTTVDFCVGDWDVDEDGNDICVSPDNVRAHNVAITSAFAGKAGTADTLTALVTDRYGNVTEGETVTFSKVAGSGYIQETNATVTIDEDGSGYIQETNGTVTTDEDGVATATLIIMSGEVGFDSTVRAAITQDAFAATSNSAAAERSAGDTNVGKTTAWTKLQADGTAKMYAKNIVGAGKVQFFHNNKEIAWVRAADALNPKLRSAFGAFYLVRTVKLVDGKNVLEVYIDGERVRRTAYSK